MLRCLIAALYMIYFKIGFTQGYYNLGFYWLANIEVPTVKAETEKKLK